MRVAAPALRSLSHLHDGRLWRGSLYDVVHSPKRLTLVFEYLDQDLKNYLDDGKGGLEIGIVKSFLYQLLRGVAYCHHHRVLHRYALCYSGPGHLRPMHAEGTCVLCLSSWGPLSVVGAAPSPRCVVCVVDVCFTCAGIAGRACHVLSHGFAL